MDSSVRLEGLKSQLAQIDQGLAAFEGEQFTHWRDDEENLHVKFNNKPEIVLPIFPLRTYQKEARHALFIDKIRYIFLVLSRRGGKEVQSWEFLIESAIEDPGTYYIIYPTFKMAKKILWDGNLTMPDGSMMKFLDMIPKDLLAKKPNNTDLKIELKTGSTIYVLAADKNIDSLRGGNLKGAVCSEFAFSNPLVYKTIMPSLIQNKGWLLLQTTFNGKNHAWETLKKAQADGNWYVKVANCLQLLDENGNRYITDEMIEQARIGGMEEWEIRQEYYCEIALNVNLYFFAREIEFLRNEKKIANFPINPRSTCYTCWDLGVSDAMVCHLFQIDFYGNPVFIFSYEDSNKPLQDYINALNEFCNKYRLVVAIDFIPHDGRNRKPGIYELTSVENDFRTLGRNPYVIERVQSKVSAIQLMRDYVRRSTIHEVYAERLLDCLSGYKREWDENLRSFRSEPVHDWASHGTDAFQTACLAIEGGFCVSVEGGIEPYSLGGVR